MRLVWLASLAAASADQQNATLTPCQQCCAPGGDCSKAYKGMPGKCCGTVQGQSYCCPGVSFRGQTSGDAKCANCGTSFRCYAGQSSRKVCPNLKLSSSRVRPSSSQHKHKANDIHVFLIVGAVVLAIVFCYCSLSGQAANTVRLCPICYLQSSRQKAQQVNWCHYSARLSS